MDQNNENREVAIQLTGVKKMYKLGQIGGGTLQHDLQSWWARVRGKEDPNTKIGQEQRLVGETFMALNGIDLTIYKGEALGIIGANGAGKSTLLKLLCRVTAPTEGEIDLYGRVSSMLEVKTGFNGEMTGRENVYMRGAILGMTKAEIDSKMEQIIEFSEVRDFIDTPVKRYSSGMSVKLGFSVSAHLDSEIMIMDEVLAVGDVAFQNKCIGKMREAAKKEGRTVLYVSHNMNTIRQLCDRCIVLDQGKIVFDGDVEEAIEVYLASNNNDKTTSFNFEDVKREQFVNNDANIISFSFFEKKRSIFTKNEKIRFSVVWKANKPINDVILRIIVRTHLDVPVGATRSGVMRSYVAAGDVVKESYQFDTSYLVSGRYFLSLSLLQLDKSGNRVIVDHLTRACPFEIVNDGKETGFIKWSQNWGSIEFPDLVRIED